MGIVLSTSIVSLLLALLVALYKVTSTEKEFGSVARDKPWDTYIPILHLRRDSFLSTGILFVLSSIVIHLDLPMEAAQQVWSNGAVAIFLLSMAIVNPGLAFTPTTPSSSLRCALVPTVVTVAALVYSTGYQGRLAGLELNGMQVADCLTTAALEEYLFRYRVFNQMASRTRKRLPQLSEDQLFLLSTLLSAALFAAVHFTLDPSRLFSYFLIAFVAQTLRSEARFPILPILYHFLHNYLANYVR